MKLRVRSSKETGACQIKDARAISTPFDTPIDTPLPAPIRIAPIRIDTPLLAPIRIAPIRIDTPLLTPIRIVTAIFREESGLSVNWNRDIGSVELLSVPLDVLIVSSHVVGRKFTIEITVEIIRYIFT